MIFGSSKNGTELLKAEKSPVITRITGLHLFVLCGRNGCSQFLAKCEPSSVGRIL